MPGVSGELAVNTRVHSTHYFRTRGCGCIGHPAFPTPSDIGGGKFKHDSGAWRRENANLCLTVIARSEATKQSIQQQKERMDCFAALAMTFHTLRRRRPRRRAIQ